MLWVASVHVYSVVNNNALVCYHPPRVFPVCAIYPWYNPYVHMYVHVIGKDIHNVHIMYMYVYIFPYAAEFMVSPSRLDDDDETDDDHSTISRCTTHEPVEFITSSVEGGTLEKGKKPTAAPKKRVSSLDKEKSREYKSRTLKRNIK